jgi:hypothetical protein
MAGKQAKILSEPVDRVAVVVQVGTLDTPGTILGAATEPLVSAPHTNP